MSRSSTSLETTGSQDSGDFEYQLLTGHDRTNKSHKTDHQLRMEYLNLTDKLIYRIIQGHEVTDPNTGEKSHEAYDTLIFLDKSARPVAWLLKAMWDKLAIDQDGKKHSIPDIRFLNIDRGQWVNKVDPNGNGIVDIDIVDDSIIQSLRSIFVEPKYKKDTTGSYITDAPSKLDNSNVMIVDEVRSSGKTLDIAKKFIRKAFPTAKVDGTYWMGSIVERRIKTGTRSYTTATGNADIPVWYNEDTVFGRGVGDRSPKSGHAKNVTQRLGRWFLSTRLRKPDPASDQLRAEIKQLTEHPDVPFRPSIERDDETYDLLISKLNGGVPAEIAQLAVNAVLRETK